MRGYIHELLQRRDKLKAMRCHKDLCNLLQPSQEELGSLEKERKAAERRDKKKRAAQPPSKSEEKEKKKEKEKEKEEKKGSARESPGEPGQEDHEAEGEEEGEGFKVPVYPVTKKTRQSDGSRIFEARDGIPALVICKRGR